MSFRYQQLASWLQIQLEQQLYPVGSRLPGVRELARQRDVSIATVLAAYQQLEKDGYIKAAPRSGFYVCVRPQTLPVNAGLQPCEIQPCPVSGQDIALALSKAAADDRYVRLGAAVPAASFLPAHALHRAMNRVLKRYPQRAMRYETSKGAVELRTQIARRMAENGAAVAPDDVVITNGCQEALMLSLKAITVPGDLVAIESPAFYGLLQALEATGLRALELPADPHTGLSLDALQQAIQRWDIKACVLIPNFSNPLGSLMPDAAKQQLCDMLTTARIPLIEDDSYGDLGFTARRPSSCLALAPKADIFYCGTFSKTISPDLRLGWVIAPRRTARLEYLKFISNISTSSLPQLAVADLLQSGRYERYLRQARPAYQRAVKQMTNAVCQWFPEGTRVSQPQGGFVLWVELPEQVDSYQLAEDARERHISIAPGGIFSPTQKYRNYIRLSCATYWDAQIDRALQTLGLLCQRQIDESARSADATGQ